MQQGHIHMHITMSGCYTLQLCMSVCLLYTTKTVAKNYIIKSGGSDFQELFKFCEGVRLSVCVYVKSIKQVFIRFYFVHRCCFCCRFTFFFCAAFDALCPAACDTHTAHTHTRVCTLAHVCVCECIVRVKVNDAFSRLFWAAVQT